MRERIAIAVAFLTVCFAISISALFAWKHNVAVINSAPTSISASNSDVSASNEPAAARGSVPPGAIIYATKHCGTCHSIGGVGNPRYPLDGVGSRLNRTELGEAIIGAGSTSAKISGAVRQRKGRYAEMQEDEMSKLIDYLATLVVAEK